MVALEEMSENPHYRFTQQKITWEYVNGVRQRRCAVAYLPREMFFDGDVFTLNIPDKPDGMCLACHLYSWGLDELRKALLLPDNCQILDLTESYQWDRQRIALRLQSPEFVMVPEACIMTEVDWQYRSYDKPGGGYTDIKAPDGGGYTTPEQVIWWDGWCNEAAYAGDYAAYRAERQRLWEAELVRVGVAKP